MFGPAWEHFGPVCLVLILGSQALTRRAQRKRWRNEARGLRTSLSVNLQALHAHYSTNLSALAERESALPPARQQINLLRTQLGRLASLQQSEVRAVMTACVALEDAEAALAAARKGQAGTIRANARQNEKRAMAASVLQETCAVLQTADDLLRADEKTVKPGGCVDDIVDSRAAAAVERREQPALREKDRATRAGASPP